MSKLFLGNVPNGFTETDIAEWIQSFGFAVEGVEMIRDRTTGISRGFGFVTLKDGAPIEEAIQKVDGQRMGNRIITVNAATPIAYTRRAG